MATDHFYQGKRLSLRHQLCTVRYVGPVDGKSGDWLGVEWDDTTRGKNNGKHEGKRYFTCASVASTAASFLRPQQKWDQSRTLGQAVREKYVLNETDADAGAVYISGKEAEEVGFSKFARRQAALRGINTLVLDHMCIGAANLTDLDLDVNHITGLDVSNNLVENSSEISSWCGQFPKLQSLILDGNRFTVETNEGSRGTKSHELHTLSLASTLLPFKSVCSLLRLCGTSLRELSLSDNEYNSISGLSHCQCQLVSLDLSSNNFRSMADLSDLSNLRTLKSLTLKHNFIRTIGSGEGTPTLFDNLVDIDVSHNHISSFDFFDNLRTCCPNLRHLRVSGNPLYSNLMSADGKPLTSQDGHMLTIARLPSLETLNHSRITDKERLNAETYYLNQIATQLNLADPNVHEGILAQHPRYHALCEEYGEPTLSHDIVKPLTDPHSLAARLCTLTFNLDEGTLTHINERSWSREIPKSFAIYTIMGMIGKRLGVRPLDLRLVWETGERDPVGREGGAQYAPEWWDSDDDDEGGEDGQKWVEREVELVAGTKPIATYIEGAEATIRVEVRSTEQ